MLKSPGKLLVLVGLFIAGLAQYFSVEKIDHQENNALSAIKVSVENKINTVNKTVSKLETIKLTNRNIDSLANGLKLQGIDFFEFHGTTPFYWTNDLFQIIPQNTNSFEIAKQGSLYLAKWNLVHRGGIRIFVYNIFPDQGLKINPDSLFEKQSSIYHIEKLGTDNSNPKNQLNFEFKGEKYGISTVQFSPSLLFAYLYIFGLCLISIGIVIIQRKSNKATLKWINWAMWFGVVSLFVANFNFTNLKQLKVFSSQLFYINPVFQSLGVIASYAVLLFWLASLIREQIKPKLKSTDLKSAYLIHIPIIISALIILQVIFVLASKLVTDTEIHFDFFEILLVTRYTMISIGVLVLLFLTFFTLLNEIANNLFSVESKHRLMIILISFSPLLTFGFFNIPPLLYYLWLFFGIIWFVFRKQSLNRFDYTRLLLQILLPCVSLSVILNTELREKEQEQRKFIASQLLLKADKGIKNHLYKSESQLMVDNGIVDYYTCLDVTKEAFENRIKELYFDGKYDKYELSIFDFNGKGQAYRNENTIDFGTLNAIYFSDLCIQVTNRFFLINERRLRGSYLGKFNVVSEGQLQGSYFVLLTPKFGNNQGRLSDVIQKNATENLFRRYDYSYAIYNRNKLNRHLGHYDYPAINLFGVNTRFTNSNGYSHYVLKDEYNNIVIITKKDQSLLISAIQFTLLSLVGFLVILLYLVFVYAQEKLINFFSKAKWMKKIQLNFNPSSSFISTESWYLSRRLQLYITWLVFAIFVIVIFVTINYFIQNNIDRQKNYLLNKANNIANKISGEVNLDALQNKYEVGLVYDLAVYYETDINVYDQYGKLIVSTNPRLFTEKFTSDLMNPKVFKRFKSKMISSSVVSEKIADLNYISAYTTLIDNDLEVRGYVNLPYFSNREDLFREISQYTVTIINLFVLIFAMAVILTYYVAQRLSKPLILIKNQISQMKIGEKNLPIDWERNDEIGLLVKEYNTMLSALDSSLDKLADSERQGAWKEMAKQVAHEIKNPLTPMRLSLQHLEYSINRGDDHIEEKVKKTIALLIRQIDSLSTMAEEFSSFAKMPEPILEKIDLKLILGDAIMLMEKEMGQPISLEIAADAIPILADPHQLGRIFNNIFKNAIQAIPEDRVGKVLVNVEMQKKWVKILISDNGKGIPPELSEKIFSPNFSTKNSGMGLGLAITKKIIEQFGGKIHFSSELNVGTVFEINFPLDL
jgi:signal transduction histidine kinase